MSSADPAQLFDGPVGSGSGGNASASSKSTAAPSSSTTNTNAYLHPVAVAFHLLFRTGAVLAYLLCGFFSDNFVTNFIVIVMLLSLDFWTVKNVSGRILVGLRWWNEVKPDGQTMWRFESRKDTSGIDANESRLFWITLYLYTAVWLLFSILNLALKFQWLLVAFVGLALNLANVIGYTKCDKNAKQKLANLAGSFVTPSMVTSAAKTLISMATSSSSNNNQTRQPSGV
ncbi:hypothetical protein CAOG_08133 [Capsaspora owczarzaki ATCC 30864]|uniref:Golgi apparatus membrane protein TVP23 homolog n=1 Tax=Capsaspora owczarzaki (strain ATCC 30864) TaxID=595528 RepID=A0A0D2UT48_CAPO3|nr:hypothetical protein CAOG_08133 [Capsaspora owczarzaki ATCC 30864]KJE98116.1 hypothetical protein, variant [Capsaspora owczarzaki ATCC 30864]|eukprot:XP_004342734.1 hypothetical protein CAOG_08133 [Capsaspora owczarzaki ATCC 30864]